MKKHIFLIALIFTLIQGGFAQAGKSQMADIDKIKKEIKDNKSYLHKIKVVKDSNGYRYEYVSYKELKLVTVYYRDKNIDKHVEWFFFKNELIYAEQTWTDNATNKVVDNEKFYYPVSNILVG